MVEKFDLDDEVLKEEGIGYVPDRRFNNRFEEQGLNCPYEHCIETMPLYEDEVQKARGLGYFSRMIPGRGFVPCDSSEQGAAEDLNRVISEFGYSPKSCRLYGHDCPGAEEQVEKCTSEGMFD